MLAQTIRGTFKFFSPDWDEVSDSAKDFISALIQVDPTKRLSCQAALDHAWMKAAVENRNMVGRVGDNLVLHFNARRKLKVL